MKNKKPSPFTEDSDTRKGYPLYTGCLHYFPDALALVSRLSFLSNEKHNAGEPLHWSREKSNDHKDCIARHLVDGDHVELAWRALANLQVEIEAGYSPFEEEPSPLSTDDYEVVAGPVQIKIPIKPRARTCATCKHADKDGETEPCKSCSDLCNWEKDDA